MRREANGALIGVKGDVFDYSSRLVVGLASYIEHLEAELLTASKLKGHPWCGKGYRGRYGANWQVELHRQVQRTYLPVTLIMDHVVREGNKIYAGTEHEDTWMLFHDGLKQWWGAKDQNFLSTIFDPSRQLKCSGATNAGNRYAETVTGNRPEICRGLDAHGFADLDFAVSYNVALSSRCRAYFLPFWADFLKYFACCMA